MELPIAHTQAVLTEAFDAYLNGNGPRFASGIEGCFHPITDTIGFKFYRNRQVAEWAREFQEHVYLRGLAPEVGSTVYSVYIDTAEYWGFYTEIAEVARNLKPSDKRIVNASNGAKFNSPSSMQEYFERVIRNAMEDAGFDFEDGHLGNWGFIGDKMVVIDFGDVGFING